MRIYSDWQAVFRTRLLGMALMLPALLASPLQAEIYKYVDDRGRQVFVDSLSRVPQQFRDQVETRRQAVSSLPEAPEQTAARAERQRHADLASQRSKLEKLLRESETPVKVGSNRVVVPVTVVYGGRKAKTEMVLDTGATNTVFHKNALAGLNYAAQPGGRARVAGGGSINTELVSFDRIEIGPYSPTNVRAMVIEHQGPAVGSDGLLGMDFLMNVRYRIDYERQLILWEPERYQELQTLLQRLDSDAAASTATPTPKP
ncbi:aspartyl protease family protein [Marinobacterium sedimentorum]|uniref:aspartyl protease family protein n=1 Tax=Marinobacterium sedimentorum TaxID=2927804 RepID=UPI0020C70CEC|nr:aspartyl protease family protein [Marinobacterium sedimentorum]MCP8688620.1 aspartyl protease family protein [Marinobacterium sedimentorum]